MLSWVAPAVYMIAVGLLVGAGAIVWFLIEHSRWRGSVDTDRTHFKRFIEKIGSKIEQMQRQIEQILNHVAANNLMAPGSPLTLTDLGKKISAQLGAKEWTERHAARLDTAGMNAYKVQELCFAYVKDEDRRPFSDDEQETIQGVASENGQETEQVVGVFAIELRDKLLAIAGLYAP